MIVVFFAVFSLGVGVGVGTVLQKHLFVKKAPTEFRWNSVDYVVQTKESVAQAVAVALAVVPEAPKPVAKVKKARVPRKPRVAKVSVPEAE